jgi:hypothetical protein
MGKAKGDGLKLPQFRRVQVARLIPETSVIRASFQKPGQFQDVRRPRIMAQDVPQRM